AARRLRVVRFPAGGEAAGAAGRGGGGGRRGGARGGRRTGFSVLFHPLRDGLLGDRAQQPPAGAVWGLGAGRVHGAGRERGARGTKPDARGPGVLAAAALAAVQGVGRGVVADHGRLGFFVDERKRGARACGAFSALGRAGAAGGAERLRVDAFPRGRI